MNACLDLVDTIRQVHTEMCQQFGKLGWCAELDPFQGVACLADPASLQSRLRVLEARVERARCALELRRQ